MAHVVVAGAVSVELGRLHDEEGTDLVDEAVDLVGSDRDLEDREHVVSSAVDAIAEMLRPLDAGRDRGGLGDEIAAFVDDHR